MSFSTVLRYLIVICTLFLPRLARAEEPLVPPLQVCEAERDFNKSDYMRMRDQFVKVAIQAEALKAKLEAAQKELDALKLKPEEKKN